MVPARHGLPASPESGLLIRRIPNIRWQCSTFASSCRATWRSLSWPNIPKIPNLVDVPHVCSQQPELLEVWTSHKYLEWLLHPVCHVQYRGPSIESVLTCSSLDFKAWPLTHGGAAVSWCSESSAAPQVSWSLRLTRCACKGTCCWMCPGGMLFWMRATRSGTLMQRCVCQPPSAQLFPLVQEHNVPATSEATSAASIAGRLSWYLNASAFLFMNGGRHPPATLDCQAVVGVTADRQDFITHMSHLQQCLHLH